MPQAGKFDGVDFSEAEPTKIIPHSIPDGQGFRCKRNEFATYWKQGRIKREVGSSICQCWCIQHNGFLAGYITLLADKLEVDTALLEELNNRTSILEDLQ